MAIRADIVIDQGTTFSVPISLLDVNNDVVNLYGYTAASTMKKWYTSSNSTTFVTSINATSGVITLSMDANTTGSLWPGRFVYDVDITSASGVVTRVVEGIITVTPGVTSNTVFTTINNQSYSNTFYSNTF